MISFSAVPFIVAGIAINSAENVGAFTAAQLPSFVHDLTTSSRPPTFRYFRDNEHEEDTLAVVNVLIDNGRAAVESSKPDTIDSIDLIRASRVPSTDSSPKIPPPKPTGVTPAQSYRPLTFEEDIEPYLDIARPYYVSK